MKWLYIWDLHAYEYATQLQCEGQYNLLPCDTALEVLYGYEIISVI